MKSAASRLEGLKLDKGWTVTRHLARNPNGTGGTFSHSYEVENGRTTGFLKAFDFSDAFEPGRDTVEAIQILTAAYDHERRILEHCEDRGLSNVTLAIDHGYVQVPGLSVMEGRVYYLIFEMAVGDVRCQMDLSRSYDAMWCMKALRDVAIGLRQVHREMIAYQDTKPSNVLTYPGEEFRVADFGRSSRRGHAIHHDGCNVAGDRAYAPPELLYGFTHPDFVPRRIGCDLYMLGNLAAFLFSGVNVTAYLLGHLDRQHHPRAWAGTYGDVLPYLHNAFARVLEDLGPKIDARVRRDVLSIISELCTPELARRGHPRGIGRREQYSLERYLSRLDLILKRLQVEVRVQNSKRTA